MITDFCRIMENENSVVKSNSSSLFLANQSEVAVPNHFTEDADVLSTVLFDQQAEMVLNDLTRKCVMKCIPRPGLTLDRFENSCLLKCSDRYLEAYRIVQNTFLKSLKSN